ncbi:hypothetical protein ANN_01369, partial [Periplaneta americana]
MIDNFLISQIFEHPEINRDTWFQQDGATNHIAEESTRHLRHFRNGEESDKDYSDHLEYNNFNLKSNLYQFRVTDDFTMRNRIRYEVHTCIPLICQVRTAGGLDLPDVQFAVTDTNDDEKREEEALVSGNEGVEEERGAGMRRTREQDGAEEGNISSINVTDR